MATTYFSYSLFGFRWSISKILSVADLHSGVNIQQQSQHLSHIYQSAKKPFPGTHVLRCQMHMQPNTSDSNDTLIKICKPGLKGTKADEHRKIVPIPRDEAKLKSTASTAAKELSAGQVIALPTDTIYGLACLVQHRDAVNQLYSIKGIILEPAYYYILLYYVENYP